MTKVLIALACASAGCSDDDTMADYAAAYAEAVVAHREACGPLTGNREKTIEFIVETTCAMVDCGAPAVGDLDACLEALNAKSCDDALAPAACVDLWY